MVETFVGDGYDALQLDEKEWEELFGEKHGKCIYRRFVLFQDEYVDVSRNHSKLHGYTKIY